MTMVCTYKPVRSHRIRYRWCKQRLLMPNFSFVYFSCIFWERVNNRRNIISTFKQTTPPPHHHHHHHQQQQHHYHHPTKIYGIPKSEQRNELTSQNFLELVLLVQSASCKRLILIRSKSTGNTAGATRD